MHVLVGDLEKHSSNKHQVILLEEGLVLVYGATPLALHGRHPLLHTGWLIGVVMGTNLDHFESHLADLCSKQVLERYVISKKVFLGHDIIDVHFATIILADILVSLVVLWPLLINLRLWSARKQLENFVFDHVWHEGTHHLLIELCLADGLAPRTTVTIMDRQA